MARHLTTESTIHVHVLRMALSLRLWEIWCAHTLDMAMQTRSNFWLGEGAPSLPRILVGGRRQQYFVGFHTQKPRFISDNSYSAPCSYCPVDRHWMCTESVTVPIICIKLIFVQYSVQYSSDYVKRITMLWNIIRAANNLEFADIPSYPTFQQVLINCTLTVN